MIQEKDVIRDEHSGAILSIKNSSLKEYKLRKQKMKEKEIKISTLEERLSQIEKMLERLNIQSEASQEK